VQMHDKLMNKMYKKAIYGRRVNLGSSVVDCVGSNILRIMNPCGNPST